MARPRAFDEEEVIGKAMMAFWRNGYDRTSIVDLEAATGLSRISIYNAFGDKEGLFARALDRYHAMATENISHCLADGTLEQIARLFEGMAAEDPDSPVNFGCLMVNTVLDVKGISPEIAAKVKAYRDMLTNSFRGALGRARDSGEIGADEDVDDLAEFLVGAMWGMLATIRLYGDAGACAPTARAVVETVRRWGR